MAGACLEVYLPWITFHPFIIHNNTTFLRKTIIDHFYSSNFTKKTLVEAFHVNGWQTFVPRVNFCAKLI